MAGLRQSQVTFLTRAHPLRQATAGEALLLGALIAAEWVHAQPSLPAAQSTTSFAHFNEEHVLMMAFLQRFHRS